MLQAFFSQIITYHNSHVGVTHLLLHTPTLGELVLKPASVHVFFSLFFSSGLNKVNQSTAGRRRQGLLPDCVAVAWEGPCLTTTLLFCPVRWLTAPVIEGKSGLLGTYVKTQKKWKREYCWEHGSLCM